MAHERGSSIGQQYSSTSALGFSNKKPALKKKSDEVHVAGLARPLTQIELVGVHRFTRQQKLRSRKSDSVQFASPKPTDKSSSRVK